MTRDHHPVEPESVELVVRNLCRTLGGHRVLSNLSFSIRSGEILFVNGPSGVGKSVLLRALASLDPIDSGSLTLNDKTPDAWTAPRWRSLVTYVHQQRIQHPGTPSQLYFRLQQLGTQRHRPRADLPTIISDFGLEAGVLNQPWQELSGGQAQRVSLGIALALKPAILLLDEPTSSLDPATVKRVERVLKNCGSAIIWVSHDPSQLDRVGGRVFNLPSGTEGQVGSPTKSKPGSSSAPAAEE